MAAGGFQGDVWPAPVLTRAPPPPTVPRAGARLAIIEGPEEAALRQYRAKADAWAAEPAAMTGAPPYQVAAVGMMGDAEAEALD